ncbi:MAG: hypothetical protein ACYCZ6_13790, partial [Polaromonas sp.]
FAKGQFFDPLGARISAARFAKQLVDKFFNHISLRDRPQLYQVSRLCPQHFELKLCSKKSFTAEERSTQRKNSEEERKKEREKYFNREAIQNPDLFFFFSSSCSASFAPPR